MIDAMLRTKGPEVLRFAVERWFTEATERGCKHGRAWIEGAVPPRLVERQVWQVADAR